MLPVLLGSALSAIEIISIASKGSEDLCNEEDWVQLQNTGDSSESLQDYILYDANGVEDGYIFDDVSMTPDEIITLCKGKSFDFGIGKDDTITLLARGKIIESVTLTGQSAPNLVYTKTNGQWAYVDKLASVPLPTLDGVEGIVINCSEATLAAMRNCTKDQYKPTITNPQCDYQECICHLGHPFVGVNATRCEVRRKGSGSWRSVDNRPSLKVKLASPVSIAGHTSWTATKLTLNNFVQGGGETNAYDVFRSFGIASPRTQLVKVCFSSPCVSQNYVLIENIDSAFAGLHFGDENACRYEAELGAVENKDGGNCPDILKADFLDSSNWNQTKLRAFIAGEIATNHYDGMCYYKWQAPDDVLNINNAYLFNVSGKLVPVPSGLDRAMQCEESPFNWKEVTACPVIGDVIERRRPRCRTLPSLEAYYPGAMAGAWLGIFAV